MLAVSEILDSLKDVSREYYQQTASNAEYVEFKVRSLWLCATKGESSVFRSTLRLLCHGMSCHVTSCLAVPCHVSCLVLSCLALSCPVICGVMSCDAHAVTAFEMHWASENSTTFLLLQHSCCSALLVQ